MNAIKARIKSVDGTMQITKAMELVASSKLKRARENVERSRPFYEAVIGAIKTLSAAGDCQDSIFGKENSALPSLYIVIAGDRGLAGGYNSNVFKLTRQIADENSLFLPIGKKALEYFKNRNLPIFYDGCEYVSDMGVGYSLDVAREIARAFANGKIGKIMLVYTKFTSMISQTPTYKQVLPLSFEKEDSKEIKEPVIEGDADEVLAEIMPEYIGAMIYSAVCESLASESGARRNAMNSANKNASEIIDTLTLNYNRARQAVITQEITEIVSGAEAL